MKQLRRWVWLCLLTAACAAQVTFRSDVRLVNVSFAVRDAAGKLIENLTQDELAQIKKKLEDECSGDAGSSHASFMAFLDRL